MDPDEKPTTNTREMIQRWLQAQDRVRRVEQQLTESKEELFKSQIMLGEWIVPELTKGEPFNIWIGSGVLQATRLEKGGYEIHWRLKPTGKTAQEFNL